MKILQVTHYFLPHSGGQEIYVNNLSKSLIALGHSVDIITSNIPKSSKFENINGINIKRLKVIAEPLRNPVIPGLLFRRKDFAQYDLINIHSLYSFSSLITVFGTRGLNIPVVLTHHGKLLFGEKWKDYLVFLYESTIGKLLLKRIDHGVCLCEMDAVYLSNLGLDKEKISVVPNGINVSEFSKYDSLVTDSTCRDDEFGKKFVILYVGEITSRKGIEYLACAMADLSNQVSSDDIILVVVGDGPDLPRLESIVSGLSIEKYVKFKGRVSLQELIQYYKRASVFVLPSLSEGMPTVILEALFFNVPVITTRLPSLIDCFSDHVLFVDPKDSKQLAEMILAVFHNEIPINGKQSGRTVVESKYSWESISKKYEEIYFKLARKSKIRISLRPDEC
jgi:glycosyltransferase involved in cell wall biosynthesis